MKYMGSKLRIAKEILPIMLKGRKSDQYFVDTFCGGCNVSDKVEGLRIANDVHPYLIPMWQHLVYLGQTPPMAVSREFYYYIKENPDVFPKWLVGWVGFNCSYSGKWFGGYAGKTQTKIGTVRDYQLEAWNNTMAQIPKLKGVDFYNAEYQNVPLPKNAIVYCDKPYQDTTKYSGADGFDHGEFWDWATETSKNHKVFVSEYNAPEGWVCVWEKVVKSSLSANGKSGGSKKSTEKLFVHESCLKN